MALLAALMDRYLSAVKSKRFVYHKDQVQLLKTIAELLDVKYFSFWSFRAFFKKRMHGIYVYGSVGSGKSTIVKMCLAHMKKQIVKQVHYNDFISEIHRLMQDFQNTKTPIAKVADKLLSNIDILYLDEMQIHDISDAMIFRQFFRYILSKKILFITTSNYIPDKLYEDGIQRESFVPTIESMKNSLYVIGLNCPDHRALKQNRKKGLYIIGEKRIPELLNEFEKISSPHHSNDVNLRLSFGHSILVSKLHKTAGFFKFAELCSNPLWTNDYSIIAKKIMFIFIEEIPQFSENNKDEARRFSMLIDELYNHRNILFCSSTIEPGQLYFYAQNDNIALRTASRLNEMCSIHST